MRRFNLVDGRMVESCSGEFVRYADVVDFIERMTRTLIAYISGLKENI